MAILSGRTAAEIADMLFFAATHGSSSGGLSMLDEAALAFREHPGVADAEREFGLARYRYQCEGDACWPAAAEAALKLALTLRPLGDARVPDGFND